MHSGTLLTLTMDSQSRGSTATELLVLLFTQYKTTFLAAISSHCLPALPAKMHEFNKHVRQKACYRNLK